MDRTTTSLTLVAFCLCLLASTVLAMSSANYRLDWFPPLTGGGGGPAASGSYAADLTVGQSAIGPSSSEYHQACLGYWCGMGGPWRLHLPLVLRSFP